MIVAAAPHQHLTYCTNIHPGESWDEVFANVAQHVVAVKARVCPDRPFGVGLRLSAAAAARLAVPEVLEAFRAFLDAKGLYVFTINGFPYGAFHGTEVKERVYRPDWLEDDRITYSDGLAHLLANLLPAGELEGSVSTVPGAFKVRAPGAAEAGQIAAALRRHARRLWQIRETTGRTITLALEPEPHCLLETTGDAVRFFGDHVFSGPSIAAFAAATGLAASGAEQALVRHLGICLDACHAAVEFEDPAEALQRVAGAGIRIAKIQISAGLRVTRPDRESLAALAAFADPVYLHQVVVRRGETLRRHLDLPEALAAETAQARGEDGCEWRVHFHVPLFQERLGPFHNTQPFLDQLLPAATRAGLCSHFEVETYTWDVLPEEHRQMPVVDAIARELAFAIERLHP
jgi:sugar phosphate isomerase/epimerase